MYDRTGNYLIVAILIGMILGVVTVAIFGEAMLPVKFLGDIFLNALKMVVIPLLFCSMIVGISNLGDVRKLGRTGLKTILYFVVTSSIAVIIGLLLVNIIQPGSGFDTLTAKVPEDVVGGESYSFLSWLTDQIPSNIIGAAAETQVLPIIVFALFFGGVLTTIGAKGKPVITFFEGVNEAIMKIVHIIMWYAPIGIFGLVAGQLAAAGGMSGFTTVLSALGKYSLVVLLGLLIHGVLVLPLILKFMGGKNPIEYFVGMSQALMTAFATASSSATLPVSMDCVEEKNDIDKRASSFVLPLGATINMDGTALYEAVAAMFIAQAYGIALPIWSQITIFATAVLASVGAAGIPQAGLVTMVLVLQAVGLPLEGIGLILAIDWFLDRCRTTVNVWGDSIGAAVIATTAEIGLVDRRQWRKVRSENRGSRGRSFTRRQDPRYKKKTDDSRSRFQKGRKPARGKKSSGSPRDSAKKSGRPFKSGDHSESRQPSGQKFTESGFSQTPKKEEYRPQSGPSKPADTQPRKPERPVAADNRSEKANGQKKRTFGRKQQKPNHAKKKNPDQGANKRTKPEITDPVESVKASSDQDGKRGFDIPQFPSSILDDLVSSKGDDSDTHKDIVAEAGSEPSTDEKGPVDAVNDNVDSRPFNENPESANHPKEKNEPDTGNGAGKEKKVSEDFSRLDEAIMGTLTKLDTQPDLPDSTNDNHSKTEDDNQETPSEMQPDFESIEEVDDEVIPKASSESETTNEKPKLTEAGDGEKDDKSDSLPTEDLKSEESDSDVKKDSIEDSESEEVTASDSDSNQSPDAEAEEDDTSKEETMKWGRSKKRRPSR
jgi:Na+/H+-dicarboxylate symporter